MSEGKRAGDKHGAYDGRERSPRACAAGGVRHDLGMYFRSRWEANFARYMNATGHAWQYEPCEAQLTLADGSAITYRPDFLVDGSYFVELKGYRAEEAAPVLAAAMTQLPKPLYVIFRPQYEAIERAVAGSIAGWEYAGSARPRDVPHLCPTCNEPTKRLNQKYCSRRCQPHPFAGRKLTPEQIARRTAARRANNNGNY